MIDGCSEDRAQLVLQPMSQTLTFCLVQADTHLTYLAKADWTNGEYRALQVLPPAVAAGVEEPLLPVHVVQSLHVQAVHRVSILHEHIRHSLACRLIWSPAEGAI